MADDVIERMCEAQWNAIHADGWSWHETVSGLAGKTEDERRHGQDYAATLIDSMRAAVAAQADWYDETPKSDENYQYTALIAAALRSLLQK